MCSVFLFGRIFQNLEKKFIAAYRFGKGEGIPFCLHTGLEIGEGIPFDQDPFRQSTVTGFWESAHGGGSGHGCATACSIGVRRARRSPSSSLGPPARPPDGCTRHGQICCLTDLAHVMRPWCGRPMGPNVWVLPRAPRARMLNRRCQGRAAMSSPVVGALAGERYWAGLAVDERRSERASQ